MALFGKGVHPKGHKARTSGAEIGVCPAPRAAYVPLSQHIGAPAVPVVEAGERVLRGQLLAKKAEGLSAKYGHWPFAGGKDRGGIAAMRLCLFLSARGKNER